MFGGVVSGLADRGFLALTPIYVVVGFILGTGGLGVLEFAPGSGFVEILAITALVVILFRDGLDVDEEMLRTQWRLPLRKLVLAMPVTAAVGALTGEAPVEGSLAGAFLLRAPLLPAPPVALSG